MMYEVEYLNRYIIREKSQKNHSVISKDPSNQERTFGKETKAAAAAAAAAPPPPPIDSSSTNNSITNSSSNEKSVSITMTTTPYSYSPKKLVKSFNELLLSLEGEETKTAETATATAMAKEYDNGSGCTIASRSNSNSNRNSSVIKVSAVQLTGSNLPESDVDGFLQRATVAVRRATSTTTTATKATATKATTPPQLVLLPELLLGPYFCQSQETCLLQNLAVEIENEDENKNDTDTGGGNGSSNTTNSLHNNNKNNVIIQHFQSLARECNVVLPISLYERRRQVLYNTVVMIDADGTLKGKYRKSHIPDGTGYQEKFYFSPGDTGFQVFTTQVGKVGVGICWDQWFPECARGMALLGADMLLYPTAIGSEPQDPSIDSSSHWQRVMQGHAAANVRTNMISYLFCVYCDSC